MLEDVPSLIQEWRPDPGKWVFAFNPANTADTAGLKAAQEFIKKIKGNDPDINPTTQPQTTTIQGGGGDAVRR